MTMAQPKAPDIKRPAKKKYRTTEDYISGFTRHCSNELSGFVESGPFFKTAYEAWLTPDHARSVALIAKENTIEQAVEWLKENVLAFSYYDPLKDDYGYRMLEMINEF